MPLIGETFEAAETLGDGHDRALASIRSAFLKAGDHHDVVFGALRLTEGVDQDTGPMLVGEADVVGHALVSGSFIAELDVKDLARLRDATRDIHRKTCAGQAPLSNEECDLVIEKLGPKLAQDMISAVVDG